MNCAKLYAIFLLSIFFVFNNGMDKPTLTGAKPPVRPSTPLVDFLKEFNFKLIDSTILSVCTLTVSQPSLHAIATEDDILEDSIWLRQRDS